MAWLAIVAVITSIISAYFYLRVVFYSFMFDSPESTKIHIPAFAAAAVVIGVLITLLLGVYPEPVIELARDAVFSTVQVLAGS